MIERRGNVTYSLSVQDDQGKPLPEIVKDDVTYIVAKPNSQFQVRVAREVTGSGLTPALCAASVCIDGEGIGYIRDLRNRGDQVEDCVFEGWRIDHRSKRAFVFGQPHSATENHQQPFIPASQSQIGSIVASFLKMESYACKAPKKRCSSCEFRGFGAERKPRGIKTASFVSQADGKKFFTAPSLTAESGRVLPTKSHKREAFHTRPVSRDPVIQLKLRFETAPILLLRKVLDQSNPEHARWLDGVHQGVQEEGEASTSKPAVERKPKTVKVEKKRGNSTRTAGMEASMKETKAGRKEAKGGWSTKLELTGIETVDLTEDDGNDDECMMYTVEKKPRPNDFVSVD